MDLYNSVFTSRDADISVVSYYREWTSQMTAGWSKMAFFCCYIAGPFRDKVTVFPSFDIGTYSEINSFERRSMAIFRAKFFFSGRYVTSCAFLK